MFLYTNRKESKQLRVSKTGAPSEQQINAVIEHYQAGRFEEAEEFAASLSSSFPSHQFAWKALGAILQQTGRMEEALLPMQKSVELSPHDAEAHSNLGVTLQDLGNLVEAKASFVKALKLNPSFAEAYNNLGNTLKKLGKLDDAKASYTKAIALKPEYAEAHKNLGNILKEFGELYYAKGSYTKAIALKPDWAEAQNDLSITLRELGRTREAFSACLQALTLDENFTEAYINLSQILRNISFKYSEPRLYPILINLLKKNIIRPRDLAASISTLIKHDSMIKVLLDERDSYSSMEKEISNIRKLNKLQLLHDFMRICPLPDLELERLFVKIRRFLLVNLDNLENSPEIDYFLSTLSLHCFTNEYVYFESEEESKLVDHLEALVYEEISGSRQPEVFKILCLASYRPLHKYNWCQKLSMLDHLVEIKKRLIEEPFVEKAISRGIVKLGKISDDVSNKVREQYEENPYPRWVKAALHSEAISIAEFFNESKLQLHFDNVKDIKSPKILIAGCGTGQHPIETASRFSGCQVTAVDLSLSSLAYAKRKTTENRFTNIEYFQADIMNLNCQGKEFDIIESVGVLHHMSDPMAGWKVLTNLLKRGGLMRIGLYSELARQDIVRARNEIKLLSMGTSGAEMKEFRRSIIGSSKKKNYQQLTKSGDFFSLSTLRDLIFHVQ